MLFTNMSQMMQHDALSQISVHESHRGHTWLSNTKATAHPTSYRTSHKLPHIPQAPAYPTSYRHIPQAPAYSTSYPCFTTSCVKMLDFLLSRVRASRMGSASPKFPEIRTTYPKLSDVRASNYRMCEHRACGKSTEIGPLSKCFEYAGACGMCGRL